MVSRQFGELPQSATWSKLRQHLRKLDGATVTEFITDHVTEAWMDFSFRGYQFSVNNQLGDYWFFANDAHTPDEALETARFSDKRKIELTVVSARIRRITFRIDASSSSHRPGQL